MYIHREDYNFLTYNLLILLYELDCTHEKKRFRDFRRVAYLVELISTDGDIKNYQQHELSAIYLRAQLKKKLLSHLLLILKNNDYLGVALNNTHRTLDIWIRKENISNDFFDMNRFKTEISNIRKIKEYTKITKASTVKKLVEDIFNQNGVLTWEV